MRFHSAWILAAFTSAVHCARSLVSILSRSSGVPILTSAPSVSSRGRVSGAASASRNALLSLIMMPHGVPAGATTASQNGDCSLGKPASTTVGTLGNFGSRTLLGNRDRAQLTGLDIWQAGGTRIGNDLYFAGQDRIEQRPSAAIRHVDNIDARFELEHFGEQMRRCAKP